jgi:outer membrane protein OmpA-like peptidoglycan-associated protein/tetratricopeptide (TPR) repeat protein
MKQGVRLLLFAFIILLNACTGSQKTLTGEQAFDQKQYLVAAKLLETEIAASKDEEEKAAKSLLIAQAYGYANKNKDATEWAKKAYELNNRKPELFYAYIDKLRANSDYATCITQLEKFAKQRPSEKASIDKLVARYKTFQQWQKEGSRYAVERLDSISTLRNEYAMVPLGKDEFIFTSDRSASTGDEKYGWTGEKFSDFYTTKLVEGAYTRPKKFSDNINTAGHEGTCAFNKSKTEMIFARTVVVGDKEDNFTQLYVSRKDADGNWQPATKLLLFGDDTLQNVGQPFLTEDSKTLFFSSDAQGGFGGKDLYVTSRTAEGWSQPRNLGPNINSDKDEVFPFLRKDGLFFFSSNGLDGMGGLDIYYAQKTGWKFSRPTNLQWPMNSGGDDFAVFFTSYQGSELPDTLMGKGYFSSNRSGGRGGDELFYFELKHETKYRLEGMIYGDIEGKPVLPNTVVQLLEMENGIAYPVASDTTDAKGSYAFTIQKNKDYKVNATAKTFFAKSDYISSKNLPQNYEALVTLNKDLSLVKIVKNKLIDVPNIFYDLDKSDIRSDAAAVLDSVVMPLLVENPDLKFELGSHTDAQGDDEYNQKLSQDRADKVVAYLIEKGISPDRLLSKGYGETQIINRCKNGVQCSDEEHQQNRRTTFKVLNPNGN